MKRTLFSVLLLFFVIPGYGKVLEIPFTQDNRQNFYLFNSRIKNKAVEISEGDALYFKTFNSIFIPFEGQEGKSTEAAISFFKDRVFGKTGGLFYESRNFMRFTFEHSFDLGMVLEFWLKPFSVESGTVVSTEYLSPDGVNRHLEAYFKSGKIYFVFENLFIDDSVPPKPKTVVISSDKILPVKEWHRHRVTYNPATGEISYFLDQELVAQVWATEDGNPGSALMYLETPQKWDYVLGKGYRGLMDNFFLSADVKNAFPLSIYDTENGLIQSRVFRFPSLVSVYDLELDVYLPKDTSVTLQYRISKDPFSDVTPDTIVPWKDYNIEHPQWNEKMKGNYIQFRTTLYPSPDGKFSPVVKSMRIKYDTLDIPSIPLGVAASSSESKITLSFRESLNKNIVGYKVYYGLKAGEYWGNQAIEGASPLFVPLSQLESGKRDGRLYYTLKGLEPGKVFYLRITALNDESLESEMSEEVSVRIRKLK